MFSSHGSELPIAPAGKGSSLPRQAYTSLLASTSTLAFSGRRSFSEVGSLLQGAP